MIDAQGNISPSVVAEAEAVRYLDALETATERIGREATVVSLAREGDAMVLYTRHNGHDAKAAILCDHLTVADLRLMLDAAVSVHAGHAVPSLPPAVPMRRMFDTAELGSEQ